MDITTWIIIFVVVLLVVGLMDAIFGLDPNHPKRY